jgi:2-desacetyl-2-hydroxyethyl bacteriochlorophyllide A dehydrogenase
MKAVKLVGKQKLEVVEVDKPVPEKGKAIIKVLNCGICGTDIHYWEQGAGMGGYQGLIMGHEFGGIIEDPGGRQDLKPGDRATVVPANPCGECYPCKNGRMNLCVNMPKRPNPGLNAPGAYAEYFSIRSEMVRKIPDSISDLSATMIEPSAVGLHAIITSGMKPGDRVLIVGGGTIGLLCAVWARVSGASYIIMTEVNEFRLAKAKELGYFDEVMDGRDPKLNSKVKKATMGGVDIAIDASASDAGINSALLMLKPGGTLVLAGVSLVPQALLTLVILAKELTVKSIYAYNAEDFDKALDFIARGALKVEHLISKVVGPEELQAAFENLHSGKSKDVKIVMRMSE